MSELYSSFLASRVILQTPPRADPGGARRRRRAPPRPRLLPPLYCPMRQRRGLALPGVTLTPRSVLRRSPQGFGPYTPQTPAERHRCSDPVPQTAGRSSWPWVSKGPPAPLWAPEQAHAKPLSVPATVTSTVPGHPEVTLPPQLPLRLRVPAAAGQASRGASNRNSVNASPPFVSRVGKAPAARGAGSPAERHGLMSLSLPLKVTVWCAHVFHVRYIKYNTTMRCTFPRQPSCHFRLTHSLLRKNAALGIYKAFQLNGHKSQVSFKPNNHWP